VLLVKNLEKCSHPSEGVILRVALLDKSSTKKQPPRGEADISSAARTSAVAHLQRTPRALPTTQRITSMS
jgi:hypothetical protein